ncbi:MAG: PEP-CTERM sorting domain-containing protein [Betaproteobacteria bacterium]|nr:PEP-CTERM sorting domain-containing protein [Betaproteobacteria bacterium]
MKSVGLAGSAIARKWIRNRFLAGALAGLGIMTASLPVSALVINIDTYLTGSTVTANAPVATLTLTQNGSNVDFDFRNFANNLPGGAGDDAFISELLFSYGGTSTLTSASFSNFGGTQAITAASFSINPPGKDAGYDFFLDLHYPTSSANRFTDGEFSTWTISNVSVGDFVGPVPGSGPASLALVHIQQVGAGPGGADSVKYVGSAGSNPAGLPENLIPEPGSLALISLGLLGLGTARRRKTSE